MYNKIFLWDKFLHLSSAMLLAAIGYSIIASYLNKEIIEKIKPSFFFIFTLTFTITVGVFWEFHEFTFDSLLHLNMQRYESPSGIAFVGQTALYDTISDMLCNTIGALILSTYGYYKIKNKPEWLKSIAFKKNK